MKQKNIFLLKEGDAWFLRNSKKVNLQNYYSKDQIIKAINKIDEFNSFNCKALLEVGCGEAARLEWIKKNLNIVCYGIDPSYQAIQKAKDRKIIAKVGTADKLSFKDNKFDILVFGFCLYLCDREDLFQIVKEADRVLKRNGYLIIYDFYSKKPKIKKYKHSKGVNSYKMDYKKIFLWNPIYKIFYHKVINYDLDDKVSISILFKS